MIAIGEAHDVTGPQSRRSPLNYPIDEMVMHPLIAPKDLRTVADNSQVAPHLTMQHEDPDTYCPSALKLCVTLFVLHSSLNYVSTKKVHRLHQRVAKSLEGVAGLLCSKSEVKTCRVEDDEVHAISQLSAYLEPTKPFAP